MDEDAKSKSLASDTANMFWEVFPQFWHSIRANTSKLAGEYGVTEGQFLFLKVIHNGIDSVSQLAELKHTSTAAASRLVDSLVEKGLVTRTENTEDRRFLTLRLTEEGLLTMKKIFAANKAWLIERFGLLEETELNVLIEALDILKRTMKDTKFK